MIGSNFWYPLNPWTFKYPLVYRVRSVDFTAKKVEKKEQTNQFYIFSYKNKSVFGWKSVCAEHKRENKERPFLARLKDVTYFSTCEPLTQLLQVCFFCNCTNVQLANTIRSEWKYKVQFKLISFDLNILK